MVENGCERRKCCSPCGAFDATPDFGPEEVVHAAIERWRWRPFLWRVATESGMESSRRDRPGRWDAICLRRLKTA